MHITQKEADDLLKLLKIPTDIGGGFEFDHKKKTITLMSANDKEEFILNLIPGFNRLDKMTYQTRARKTIILARLDIKGPPHRNPDDELIECPHLHIYREGYGDKWAYPIPEIFHECQDLWEFLVKFCEYCNIQSNPFNQPVVTF